MLHPSTQKLIDRLAEMTALGRINWIEADGADAAYSTDGYSVHISTEPPRIVLATDSGKLLEDVTSSDLNGTSHKDGGTYGDLVAGIARNASRVARGTETAINTLLAHLEDDPSSGDEATGKKAMPVSSPAVRADEVAVSTAASVQPDDDFEEEDVSGAVARLADEVNGTGKVLTPVEPQAATTQAHSPSARQQDPATTTPSFTVTPDDAPHMQAIRDDDEIADASSGPLQTEAPAAGADADSETGITEGPSGPLSEADISGQRPAFDRYVPFGASGLQAAGAEASDDRPEEDDLESELGAASTGMVLPRTGAWQPGDPPLSEPLHLGGVVMGMPGAGATRASFDAHHSPDSRLYDDFVEEVIPHRTVVIDAMDDFEDGEKSHGAHDLPDVSDLTSSEDSAGEAAVSETDLDAVAPPEPENDDADDELFETEADLTPSGKETSGATSGKAENTAKPRLRTRFNPWS